jgi:hypothetical protein
MQHEQDFPAVPEVLLKELERRFPDRCPDPKLTDREIWMKVGAVQVVRFLRAQFDEQHAPLHGDLE